MTVVEKKCPMFGILDSHLNSMNIVYGYLICYIN